MEQPFRNAVFKDLQKAGYEIPVPRQELKIDHEKEQSKE